MFFLSIEFQETGHAVAAPVPDASLQPGDGPMPPFPGTPEIPSWPLG